MRRNVNGLLRTACCTLAMFFLVGCFEVHRGLYRAENVKGWNQHEAEGVTYLWRDSRAHAIAVTGGTAPGWLKVRLTTYSLFDKTFGYGSIKFFDDQIRIVFHDREGKKVISASNLVSEFTQGIDVNGSMDFTMVLPSFEVEGITIPQLSVRFKWSDSKYVVWIPIQ